MNITSAARAALLGLVLAAVTSCASAIPGQAVVVTGATTTRTTVATTTPHPPEFHPHGSEVPRGATVTVPAGVPAGRREKVHVRIGDLLELPEGNWLPDNPTNEGGLIGGVMTLIQVDPGRITYQALAAGSLELAVGPVGHPGGCNRPGTNCPDATPPPTLMIIVA